MTAFADATARRVAREDGPDLHVVDTGPAPGRPLLFVHGYSMSHLVWREQFDGALAADHRLVAVDLRGHGDSAKPRDAYGDGDAWAGDVAAVLDALGLDDVVLVGWSYGSLVALDHLLARGTDRVAGANLVGVVAGIGDDRTDAWLGADYVDLFPAIVSPDAETAADALAAFVDVCFRPSLSTHDRYLLLGAAAAVPPRVRDGMRDRATCHLDALADLSVPTLLTHGVHDRVVDVAATRAVAERLPAATRSEYADAGHAPFWTASDRFDRELGAFAADPARGDLGAVVGGPVDDRPAGESGGS